MYAYYGKLNEHAKKYLVDWYLSLDWDNYKAISDQALCFVPNALHLIDFGRARVEGGALVPFTVISSLEDGSIFVSDTITWGASHKKVLKIYCNF